MRGKKVFKSQQQRISKKFPAGGLTREKLRAMKPGKAVTVWRYLMPLKEGEWRPPTPDTGIVEWVHPAGHFAVVRFKCKVGEYREAFPPEEIMRSRRKCRR